MTESLAATATALILTADSLCPPRRSVEMEALVSLGKSIFLRILSPSSSEYSSRTIRNRTESAEYYRIVLIVTSRSMSIPTNLFGQIDWHSHIHTRTCTRTQGGKARAPCPGRDCWYCEGFPPRCCLLTAHTLSLAPPALAPALRLPLPFSPAVAPGRWHRRKAMARSWSLRRGTSPLSPRGE